MLHTELHVSALEAAYEWNLEADGLGSADYTLCDGVALHDATKNVYEDGLHLRIAGKNLERLRDLLLVSAAADVEEVGRRAAVELNDVHRCHGKTSAVN